jgi:hypothetical protein
VATADYSAKSRAEKLARDGAVSICRVLKPYLKGITDNDSLEVYELRELTTRAGDYQAGYCFTAVVHCVQG